MTLKIKILTPSKTLVTGEASSVVAPSESGEVEVLPQHTDYLTTLGSGRLVVRQQGSTQDFQIIGGLCQVTNDDVTILVDGLQE